MERVPLAEGISVSLQPEPAASGKAPDGPRGSIVKLLPEAAVVWMRDSNKQYRWPRAKLAVVPPQVGDQALVLQGELSGRSGEVVKLVAGGQKARVTLPLYGRQNVDIPLADLGTLAPHSATAPWAESRLRRAQTALRPPAAHPAATLGAEPAGTGPVQLLVSLPAAGPAAALEPQAPSSITGEGAKGSGEDGAGGNRKGQTPAAGKAMPGPAATPAAEPGVSAPAAATPLLKKPAAGVPFFPALARPAAVRPLPAAEPKPSVRKNPVVESDESSSDGGEQRFRGGRSDHPYRHRISAARNKPPPKRAHEDESDDECGGRMAVQKEEEVEKEKEGEGESGDEEDTSDREEKDEGDKEDEEEEKQGGGAGVAPAAPPRRLNALQANTLAFLRLLLRCNVTPGARNNWRFLLPGTLFASRNPKNLRQRIRAFCERHGITQQNKAEKIAELRAKVP